MKLSRAVIISSCLCFLSPMLVHANTNSALLRESSSSSLSSTNRLLAEGDSGGEAEAEGEAAQDKPPPSPTDSGPQDPNTPVHDKDNHQPILFNRKQLVLFGGPHKSASTSVEEFMAQWAEGGWKHGHPHTKALGYWRWPRVMGTYGTHGTKVFGRLVTEPSNDILHKSIMDSIAESMEEAENGVIVGTEEFDQVGPDATYKALPAIKKVIRHLDLNNEDVTIVLNYRSPRLDQWVSIWKHEEGDFMDSTYEDFLCMSHNDPAERRRRYDMLGAQMNPLGAAQVFLEEGWKVKLIDMGGVEAQDKDISHVIGCRVLLGGCLDGFLGSLGDELPRENAVEKPFDELNDEESGKMEQLFENRDCGYQHSLQKWIESGQMEIEYQDSLWKTCDSKRKSYYSSLVGATDVLFNAFLSQLECKDNPHDLRDGITMDQALGNNNTLGHMINGFVEAVLIPLVFLGGVGYVMMMMFKGKQQRRLDERGIAVSQAEMTPYPSSAFQDDHEEETEEGEEEGDEGDSDDDVEEVYQDPPRSEDAEDGE
mmetsp:Transcript_35160/g.85158  ORF Transcript_35160/g.85158 Transcript_35160/m.85158 type:complete len:538 (+) Transcript_35160:274-1887(+)|eukprot:CAMPEP_0113648810 /NCGR_PEP_ID=MMETSP0017_2-20120614/25912_1 /TAXON_ID=2856 /ORGANISM="Cylindrotheca closterium" /LENGTH=537 /DNA_ID=CAMNT_0000561097 /DNA_START=188 /DNA_END=1801 /DNA_ORIENTATION=+ /assembly_acc=CAM_ASM_000147